MNVASQILIASLECMGPLITSPEPNAISLHPLGRLSHTCFVQVAALDPLISGSWIS
jgi:hypothetical protein